MFRTKILPILALLGVGLAIWTVRKGSAPPAVVPPVVMPAKAPFVSYVAGAGVLEASSENISIAAPVSGLVMNVAVQIGQEVRVGDPLFSLDDRQVRADLLVKEASIHVAREELADLRNQLSLWEKVKDRRAVSEQEFSRREYAVKVGTARVQVVEAEAQALRTELNRLTVRSPIDGMVLQVKVRPGEYAPAQVLSQPLLVLGAVNPMNVRVDIDENDAWRVQPGARAKGFLRGNPKISMDLEFRRFEPFVIPKRSLTGESSERVDTRVLQLIYSYPQKENRAYVGQLLDVYVEATANE
jgi:HlyD family secretion protein